jgi:hypothetical protein
MLESREGISSVEERRLCVQSSDAPPDHRIHRGVVEDPGVFVEVDVHAFSEGDVGGDLKLTLGSLDLTLEMGPAIVGSHVISYIKKMHLQLSLCIIKRIGRYLHLT